MGLFRRKGPGASLDHEDPASPEPGSDARTAVHAGVPGRCPECDGFGYIDNIDLRSRIQTQHCRECGHLWEFRFDEDGEVIDLRDGVINERQGSASTSR